MRHPRVPVLRRACAALAAAALTAMSLAATAVAPASAAATPPEGPAGDAFYTPPSPLPPGANGDVIWQRKQGEDSKSTTYLVLYRSTSATDQPIAVSGTVRVPRGKALGSVPIVAVAPGTTGLGDSCASSKFGIAASVMTPGQLIDSGWAVATTDYEGLGTPGVHTYVVGRSEGHAVLDIARAAQRLGIGLSERAPVGVYGYSQGGGGALWAAELAGSYAPELDLRGTAAGGTPADMIAMGKALDGSLAFGFLAAAAAGFNAAYPELDLPKYLNAEGTKVFAENQDSCVQDVILKLAFKRISSFTTTNPMQQPDWQARLRENSLGQARPTAPVFMWHGIVDEIVPYDQDRALWRTYCRQGVKATFTTSIAEHVSGLFTEQGNAVNFLRDRFAGKPATSNCR